MKAISRREALKRLGLLGGAALAAGCTPARIGLGLYPARFKEDEDLVRGVLAALAATILPGAGLDEPSLCRPFYDDRFPLHRYRTYLAADLCERSRVECGQGRFDLLPSGDRIRVLEAGLGADDTTRKLYTGAIFLTQLAFYSGFYGDVGCPEIDFDGQFRPGPPESRTYPAPMSYLAEPAGTSGNYT